jgi:hypothetical protein
LTVQTSISATLDFLVCGSQLSESIHVEKARKIGVTILTEKEYHQSLPQIEDGIKLLKMIFSKNLSDVQQGLTLLKTKQAQLPTSKTPISIYTQHLSSINGSLFSAFNI